MAKIDGIEEENGIILDNPNNPQPIPIDQAVSLGSLQPGENLAKYFSQKQLAEMARKVLEDYDNDVQSRSGWDARRAKWLKLFSGQRDPKNDPWENCSNTHVPLLAIACLQFQARAYEALLPPKEIVNAWSTDGRSVDAAIRVGKYMNYQLYYKMEEWEENMDTLLLHLPLMGSAYKKTYYEPLKKRITSQTLGIDEFVTPYRAKRIEDAARKTHIISMNVDDVQERAQKGYYLNIFGDTPIEGSQLSINSPTPEYDQMRDTISNESQSIEHENRTILEQHRFYRLTQSSPRSPLIMTVDKDAEKILRIVDRSYLNPITGDKEYLEFFTGYTFIPNLDSHYGYGFGHLIEHLNETATTILNQLIDAGSLANRVMGFITKRSGLKKGDLKFKMGQFLEVDTLASDIKSAIYQLQFKEPSNVLYSLLGLIQQYVREITTVSETMMGKLPPTDTTATTMLAVLEQGMKVFSTIHKRVHRSFKKELAKIYYFNGIYLNEVEYFTVQDSTAPATQTLMQSGRADFQNPIDVIPVSDPNIMSRAEKLAKSKAVLDEVKANPILNQDPMSLYEATRQYFVAMEVQNVDIMIKKPKPVEPPDLPPVEENAMFLREVMPQVLPIQDHDEHLRIHEDFLNSTFGMELGAQGKNIYEQHRKDHLSLAYLKAEAMLEQGRNENMAMIQNTMMGAGNAQ